MSAGSARPGAEHAARRVDVGRVSRTMRAVLEREGRPILHFDGARGRDLVVTPAVAASAVGLLPAFVVAGEAIWREISGKGFALDIPSDLDAVLGYRLRSIGAASFTTVMLAIMEATAQASATGPIIVHELNAVWAGTTDRLRRQARAAERAAMPRVP